MTIIPSVLHVMLWRGMRNLVAHAAIPLRKSILMEQEGVLLAQPKLKVVLPAPSRKAQSNVEYVTVVLGMSFLEGLAVIRDLMHSRILQEGVLPVLPLWQAVVLAMWSMESPDAKHVRYQKGMKFLEQLAVTSNKELILMV
jgi:hypothetical protein